MILKFQSHTEEVFLPAVFIRVNFIMEIESHIANPLNAVMQASESNAAVLPAGG